MPETRRDNLPAPLRAGAPADPRATVWEVIRSPWRFAAVYAGLGCPLTWLGARGWRPAAARTLLGWSGCCAARRAWACSRARRPAVMP